MTQGTLEHKTLWYWSGCRVCRIHLHNSIKRPRSISSNYLDTKIIFTWFNSFSWQNNHGGTQTLRMLVQCTFIQCSQLRIIYRSSELYCPLMNIILRKKSESHKISTITIWIKHAQLQQMFKNQSIDWLNHTEWISLHKEDLMQI